MTRPTCLILIPTPKPPISALSWPSPPGMRAIVPATATITAVGDTVIAITGTTAIAASAAA